MARKDKTRLQLAAKIRQARLDQKNQVFDRKGEDPKVKAARDRMDNEKESNLSKSIREHNEKLKKAKKSKQKKSLLDRIFKK